MIGTNDIFVVIAGYLPFFSGLTWVLLFSIQRSDTCFESRVKQSLLYFFLAAMVSWFSAVTDFYLPQFFARISLLAVAAYVLAPVLYYRFVYVLTPKDGQKPFSRWHYLAPGLVLTALLFPLGLDDSQSAVYHRNVVLELLFIIPYSAMSLKRLITYYGNKPPTRWMAVLVSPLAVTIVITLFALIQPAATFLTSGTTIALIIIFISIYSVLGYCILRSQFMHYVVNSCDKTESEKRVIGIPPAAKRRIAEVIVDDQGRQVFVKLTQKRFEDYIHKNKPYLNPQLKITDLIEPLRANRTVISNFVNKTYGMNFNQYINTLRLKELDRLRALPSNANKELAQLIEKAGFATMRNYTRAMAAQTEQ